MDIGALGILLVGSTPDGIDCESAADEYGNGSACEIETGIFLYGLVRRYKPTHILETGTHWGFASSWLALGLKDNVYFYPNMQRGRLYTVDATAYDGKPEALWRKVGVSEFVTHAIEDSREYTPPCPSLDMIFFDADHGVPEVVAEWKKHAPLLSRKRALALWHDSRLDVREAEAIRHILRERLDPILEYRHIGHMPFRNMRGLDLLMLSNEEY